MCCIPLWFMNSEYLSLVNVAALSEKITSGRPRCENDFLNSLIVVADVEVLDV